MPNGDGENSPQSLDDGLKVRLEREFEANAMAEEVIVQLFQDMKDSGIFKDGVPVILDDVIEFAEKWFENRGMELERRAAGVTDMVGVEGGGGHHGRWTSADDRVLMAMLQDNQDNKAIATRLGRTVRAVRDHIRDLGL